MNQDVPSDLHARRSLHARAPRGKPWPCRPVPQSCRLPRQYLPLAHGRGRVPPGGARGGTGRRDRIGRDRRLACRQGAGSPCAGHGLRHGIDISGYSARQVEPGDFRYFTHIFALDRENLADLHAIAPQGGRAEVALLLDLVEGREGQSVADPFHGGEEGFEATWADVSAAAQALVRKLGG